MTSGASFRLGNVATAMVAAMLAGIGCGDEEPATAETSAAGTGGGSTSAAGGGNGTGGMETGGAGGTEACGPGTHAGANGGCEATLTGWTAGPPVASKRDHHITFVAVGDTGPLLYAAGGGKDNADFFDDIEMAPILPDGSVGRWSAGGTLPAVTAGAGVAVVGETVIVAGGFRLTATGNPTLSAATDVGRVQADGTIAEWTVGPKLAATRFHLAMVETAGRLWVIGGLTGNNTTNTPKVETAMVSDDGAVSAWSEVTPLPEKRSHHGAAIHDGAIYVTGGLSGDPSAGYTNFEDVLRAEILADGQLGAWTQVGTLPMSMTTHSSFVHAGRLYLVGGIEGDAHNTASVRSASIGDDGAIGAWEDAPELPKARAHAHQTPLYEGTVYAVAGALNHISIADVFIGKFE